MANKMKPIHPGEILEDELEEIGVSASALARYLAVPANRIYSIINRQRSITADTALRLAKFFGTSPEFWLNLQSDFDLKMAIKKSGKRIEKEVIPSEEVA
jgi:addiction module HigA family antidote